ncbi:MAG: sigma-70 family RNA polymerase sigma factor [Caldilineae bacterium]|nr:MAG: sigma-70 family RNA polymerase sigma factor [Caldilineae bacterium]
MATFALCASVAISRRLIVPTASPVNYRQLDDATLMQLIARREAGALSELYDRYGRLVYTVAYNAVADSEGAEEITQEVFIQAWQNAHTYRSDRSKVATWLTSITRYRSIDFLRRRKVRHHGRHVPWDTLGDAVHAQDGVGETVEQRLQQDRVRRALGTLPPEQQQVLALAYFQGYSQREIAELLDLPLGTVKTRVRLAMQKLRQMLNEG